MTPEITEDDNLTSETVEDDNINLKLVVDGDLTETVDEDDVTT